MPDPTRRPAAGNDVTRRGFIAGSATAGATAIGGVAADHGAADAQSAAPTDAGLVRTTITVNGTRHALALDPRTTVLDLLREDLNLTGTKPGCNHGQCGACTVLVDGKRVNSCLMLAAAADGATITTVEGLSEPSGELHPMQAAFITHDGFQCGYCTPGQIVSAIGCVNEGHAGSSDEIREYMSGNLCRCGAYRGILAAIEEARDATAETDVAVLTEDAR